MTNRNSTAPIWPFVLVVGCLLLLTILAPFSWRSLGRSGGADGELNADAGGAVRQVAESGSHQSTNRGSQSPSAAVAKQHATAPAAQGLYSLETAPAARHEVPLAAWVGDQFTAAQPVDSAEAPPPDLETPGLADRIVPLRVAMRLPSIGLPDARPAAAQLSRGMGAATTPSYWHEPTTLISRLTGLAACDETIAAWCREVVAELSRLDSPANLDADHTTARLARLKELTSQTHVIPSGKWSPLVSSELMRVRYALERRLAIWDAVNHICRSAAGGEPDGRSAAASFQDLIKGVRAEFAEIADAANWETYLLLTAMEQSVIDNDNLARQALARRALSRINAPKLDAAQRQVLQSPGLQAYQAVLQRWACDPVDYRRLLLELERYEAEPTSVEARELAQMHQAIQWSGEAAVQQLGQQLNMHYRNANVRVAFSDQLLNRLLPAEHVHSEEFRDQIAGANVYGTSRGSSRLRVVLLPDRWRWRLGLEADGELNSEASARRGPATFYNEAYARYLVRKLFMLDRRGLFVEQAQAEAESDTALLGLETEFDGVPLVGWLARSIARQQHEDALAESRYEVDRRVARRVGDRVDREVQERLDAAEERVEHKVLNPIRRLELRPSVVDMQTTETHLVARYRLASDLQLAAHTPRPKAPVDSWFAVQIHESALNNILEQLPLNGRRSSLPALYHELAGAFERTDFTVPEDITDDMVVEFVEHDAVRLTCEDGRVAVTLRIKELKHGRWNKWHNFAVRVYYVPDPSGRRGDLVRDGSVEVIDAGIRNRLALYAIFNRVFPKDRVVSIVHKRFSEHPNLTNLVVNQFVVEHGWISVALGEPLPANATVADRPETAAGRVNR